VHNIEPPHEHGQEIAVDDDDYYTTLAAAKAKIPACYITNAILVDHDEKPPTVSS
jgi:hypothetical protein